jgi:hypothetical protein
MVEHDVRKALKERVEQHGGEVRAAAWLGRSHCPDVFVLLPGRSVWIETKRPKKDATEGQAREHDRMRAAGCVVLVISTIEQLDDWLAPL